MSGTYCAKQTANNLCSQTNLSLFKENLRAKKYKSIKIEVVGD